MKLAYLLLVIPLLCGILFAETVQQCAQRCCVQAGGAYSQGSCEKQDYSKYDPCTVKCNIPESTSPIPYWCYGAIIPLAGTLLIAGYKISVKRR